ncbi:oxamate carbamoyltransferase subunit AllH family protein [Nocardioides sp. Soil805]|uniref:oxamate carbamoyltransferase subunit AllH family protein n=1 Tax=Nocardioides sp. Soil805 TaxID=1736416 RepID=UPI0009EAF0AB|nr:DUF2877 domain-containing protein [Nocardioides sp. Soil805]
MTAELPVSASARLRDLVAGLPDSTVTVLHRGAHAIYLDVEGIGCVGVLGARATAVPNGLRLAAPTVARLRGDGAVVRDGVLRVDGTALPVRRAVDVAVPRLTDAGRAAPVTPVLVTELAVTPQQPERLVGRGSGLTPLGDDVVCGWVAMHRAAGLHTPDHDARVRDLLPRTTRLSAALLECALRGEVLPQFAAYVAALGTPAEGAATTALTAVGHTSGLGLLAGAVAARRHLLDTDGYAA